MARRRTARTGSGPIRPSGPITTRFSNHAHPLARKPPNWLPTNVSGMATANAKISARGPRPRLPPVRLAESMLLRSATAASSSGVSGLTGGDIVPAGVVQGTSARTAAGSAALEQVS